MLAPRDPGCLRGRWRLSRYSIDFRRLDLGDKETEFYWIARAGVPCCDIVQHRDRHRIAGAIVNEPADVWIMIDVIEGERRNLGCL